MDRYTFSGNLGKDAEIKALQNGKQMIVFNVAIDKSYKDATGTKIAKTKWVSCSRFLEPGKPWPVGAYLKAGTKVLVDGEPSARGWANQAGEIQGDLNVNVFNVELMGSAPQANAQAPAPGGYASPQANAQRTQAPQPTYTAPAADTHLSNPIPTDDLPF